LSDSRENQAQFRSELEGEEGQVLWWLGEWVWEGSGPATTPLEEAVEAVMAGDVSTPLERGVQKAGEFHERLLGRERVTLYRGGGVSDRGLLSFTFDREVAESFGPVVEVAVPAERIFFSPAMSERLGGDESEVLVWVGGL